MKIYIAGKITGLDPVEARKKFDADEEADIDLDQLCAQIEIAWYSERDVSTIDRFAEQYPQYSSDLYDFFALLIETDLSSRQFDSAASTETARKWLEAEGFEDVRKIAASTERPTTTTPDPSDVASSTEVGEGSVLIWILVCLSVFSFVHHSFAFGCEKKLHSAAIITNRVNELSSVVFDLKANTENFSVDSASKIRITIFSHNENGFVVKLKNRLQFRFGHLLESVGQNATSARRNKSAVPFEIFRFLYVRLWNKIERFDIVIGCQMPVPSWCSPGVGIFDFHRNFFSNFKLQRFDSFKVHIGTFANRKQLAGLVYGVLHSLPLMTVNGNLHKNRVEREHSDHSAYKGWGIVRVSDEITGSDKQTNSKDDEKNDHADHPAWVPPLWVVIAFLIISVCGSMWCVWHISNDYFNRNTKKT